MQDVYILTAHSSAPPPTDDYVNLRSQLEERDSEIAKLCRHQGQQTRLLSDQKQHTVGFNTLFEGNPTFAATLDERRTARSAATTTVLETVEPSTAFIYAAREAAKQIYLISAFAIRSLATFHFVF